MLRRPPATILFLLIGAVAALVVRVPGADPLVHLRFLLGCGAFLVVGGALEELFGLSGPFVFHRIVLGQLGLCAWFCLRSLLPGPGVGRIELAALVLGAGALLWQKRRREPVAPHAAIWAAWWASTLVFVGAWSGRLETPCSDTDSHAWFARLTVLAGDVVRTQAPWSDAPISYPSGFSILNSLWSLASFVHPVQVVDCQVALQSCLVVGLALEAMVVARGKVAVAPALLVIVAAHLIVTLPINSELPLLAGTARLAHKALLVFPLTFALRAGERRRASVAAGIACAGFALIMNPAQLVVIAPILCAAAVVVATGAGERGLWRGAIVGALAAGCFLSADAWLRSTVKSYSASRHAVAASQAESRAEAPAHPSLRVALRGGLAQLEAEGVPGCLRSGQCRSQTDTLALLIAPLLEIAAALALLLRRRSRASVAILAILAVDLVAVFLSGAIDAALSHSGDFNLETLRIYTVSGLAWSTAILLLIQLALGLALIGQLLDAIRPEADLIATAALVALWSAGAASLSTDLAGPLIPQAPPSSLGPIDRGDLELVLKAEGIVPPGESVILPGYTLHLNAWEHWEFATASGRAIPLYSNLRFAFFLGEGNPIFDAEQYRQRVCRALDLRWLAEHGALWIVVTDSTRMMSCVHAWDYASGRYFEERLRVGDKALYRLRPDRLAEAARDTVLDVPLDAPLVSAVGGGLQGELWVRGPLGVAGFACDRGSAAPVTVELALTSGELTLRELHGAAVPLGSRAPAACVGDAHGFSFAPVRAPPGTYRARVFARDGHGGVPLLLGDGIEIRVQ